MRSIQPKGPYRISGYCAGGLAAFELARQLFLQGDQVDALLLLDVPFGFSSSWANPDRVLRFLAAKYLPAQIKTKSRWLRSMHALLLDEGLGAHVKLFRDYHPSHYPGRIVLFEASWTAFRLMRTRQNWKTVAGAGLTTHRIAGDHDNFLRKHAPELAEQMMRYL